MTGVSRIWGICRIRSVGWRSVLGARRRRWGSTGSSSTPSLARLLQTPICYRPGDLGDTPYLCTSARPACPDGYVCAVSLGACVRKSASSRQVLTGPPKTGPTALAATAIPEPPGRGPAQEGYDEPPEAEVEVPEEAFAEEGERQGHESGDVALPNDRGP